MDINVGFSALRQAASLAMPAAVRSLPSFFVIGPPRTGTTWLHEVLRKRTALPSITKETRFFDIHYRRGLPWYRAHYRKNSTGQAAGEIAPTYFASSEARERLARTVPGAKVVCTFRNPVHRIVSLYRVKRAYGIIHWSFEEALRHDPEMMESSRYATNLKDWLTLFGRNQVMTTVYDDLRENPQAYVDGVAEFIGIPKFVLAPAEISLVHSSEEMTQPRNFNCTRGATIMADWFKARRLDLVVAAVKASPLQRLFLGGGPPFPDMAPELLLKLYEIFRPEIEDLEELLNRDFSAWKYIHNQVRSAASGL
jgi:LPS sulfotransferase NodH